MRLLLKHGADINLKETGTYFSPLTLAVVTHNVSIVKLLIENSAEVNSYQRPLEEWDWDGDMGNRKDITPIQHAVFGKQKEIVKLLLKAGAHPHGVGPINNYDNSCMTLNFSIMEYCIINI